MTDVDLPEDRRLDRLSAALEAHGLDSFSSLESGLRAALRLNDEAPGTFDATLDLILGLALDGIDPSRVLGYAVPAVIAGRATDAAPVKAWLAPVDAFVRELHAREVRTWDAVSYGVRSLAELCGPDLPQFRSGLSRFGGLLVRLNAEGTDTSRLVTYGIGALCQALQERPWALEPAFQIAERVSATEGGEPGWILQVCVSEWAQALLQNGGASQEQFERALEALGDFLERCPEAGMSAGSRLSDGLATLARYGPGMLPHVDEWLDLILALIRSMSSQEMSPYLAIGNGLGGIVGQVRPAELSGVLRFASQLADHGTDPGPILYEAFLPAAHALGSPLTIDIGRRLAAQGFDPFYLLRDAAAQVGRHAQAWPEDVRTERLEEALELVVVTAERLHGMELQGQKYLMDAVPFQAQTHSQNPGLWLEALRLGARLADQGIDPGMTLAFGWAAVHAAAIETPWILEEGRAAVEELGALGVDPEPTLTHAFPVLLQVAEGDPSEFQGLRATLTEVTGALAAAGVDPKSTLFHDVSALAELGKDDGAAAFRSWLLRLRSVLQALEAGGLSPARFLESGLPAATRAAKDVPSRLDVALALMTDLAHEGHDGTALLQYALAAFTDFDNGEPTRLRAQLMAAREVLSRIPAEALPWSLEPLCRASAAVSGGDPTALSEVLGTTVLETVGTQTAAASPGTQALVSALPMLAELAGTSTAGFAALTRAAQRELLRLAAAERDPEDLLWYGLRTLVNVAPADPEGGARCITALGELLTTEDVRVGQFVVRPPRTLGGYGGALRSQESALSALAHLTAGDVPAFLSGLPPIAAAARAFGSQEDASPDTFNDLLRAAAAIPPRTPSSFSQELEWLVAQLGAEELQSTSAAIIHAIAECRELIIRLPSAWTALLRPALAAHGVRSAPILRSLKRIADPAVQQDSDLEILTEIVTQTGVRANEILEGLIWPGLHNKTISSLTDEKGYLSSFLQEVPLADPEIYRSYRAVQRDDALSQAQKDERIQALQGTLETLADAVRSGEVSAEDARSPLFALVLYHVFPPAMSSSRGHYARLYQRFEDHLDHVTEREPQGAVRRTYGLRQGAWELRPDAVLDRTPWELVTSVARALRGDGEGEPRAAGDLEAEDLEAEDLETGDSPVDLGWTLLARWSEGRIGRESIQRELLARILQRAHAAGVEIPHHAETPAELIACKEFLGDHLRDVVEQSLIAARVKDASRYDRMVRDKLAPAASVGPGLVKSMWQLAQGLRDGRVSDADASARLSGQLRGFAVDSSSFQGVLAGCQDREAVGAALRSLTPETVAIEAGKEQSRLLADFVGQALATMHRELFGGQGAEAKLVYQTSDTAPALEITCELTKRRAHAPIGLCQGVCVATDEELWNQPNFFQVIFWGPDGIAAGGMHVLVVQEDGEDYVALPGINPSMRLLGATEPECVLDLALDFAWRLARRWNCAGVWIPTSTAIHSNRRAIHQEIARRGWSTRATAEHKFSYSPYRYTFSEVLLAPESPG